MTAARAFSPFVLATLMACQSSCLPTRTNPDTPVITTEQGARDLYAVTVRIQVDCVNGGGGWGSGVIVSPRHVLTAKHVVEACTPAEPWKVTVETHIGTKFEVVVDTLHEHVDAARLVVTGVGSPFRSWARIAHWGPEDGQWICFSAHDVQTYLFQFRFLTPLDPL